jgi:hypothetical protein
VNAFLAIIIANVAYLAIFVPLELWREKRRERLEILKGTGPACERAGWHPVAFCWRGRFHTRPEFEMRHRDGRRSYARVGG